MQMLIKLSLYGALSLGVAAATAADDSQYPVKIGPTGRYLVDRHDKPFLIAGESPQGMMVNVSEADAELFFKNRQSHGFNTAWINLICAKYTGGREDASTFDGIKPFKSGRDFSEPNEEYFARCDRIIRIAAKYGTLVMLDPAETGSFLEWMQKNGTEKCRDYGRYLGKRYKDFDNILWFHGNDYSQDTAANDKLVTAIAEGIKDAGDRHLHTIEIDWKSNYMTSLDNERWAKIVGLSAAYTYKPVYLPLLKDYNRKTDHRVPTFMVESSYEFENVANIKYGDPRQLRYQEYTSNLCGSTGQLYGNKFTWPFLDGWKEKLDTPGAVQMKYVQALFEPRRWYDLVPDQDHKLLTEGFGKFGEFNYAAAARTPDGKLAIAYIPDKRSITIDMGQLVAPAVARWYDPASGKFRQVEGSPLQNRGSRQLTAPGNNADGPGNEDWVLLLEADRK
ncbi:MAG TPA: DUF4038 domain-containing protein [Pirellulales bacterium]|nr:DUF4038 domain-containing protein [Pirellulales bacterium]